MPLSYARSSNSNSWETDVLLLVHTNINYFVFLIWCEEFRFKALHTHTVQPHSLLSTWGEQGRCGKYCIIKMQISPLCPLMTLGDFLSSHSPLFLFLQLETLMETSLSERVTFPSPGRARRAEQTTCGRELTFNHRCTIIFGQLNCQQQNKDQSQIFLMLTISRYLISSQGGTLVGHLKF